VRFAAKEIVELVHAHNRVARAREELTALDRDEARFLAFVSLALLDVDRILAVRPDRGAWRSSRIGSLVVAASETMQPNGRTPSRAAALTGAESSRADLQLAGFHHVLKYGPRAHGTFGW
jgi:hypothetical protein